MSSVENVAPAWEAEIAKIGLERGNSLLESIKVDVPAATVWKSISEPGYLKWTHPFCKETEVIKWPGADSRDSITYYSGRKYERHFVDWFDGIGYDLQLGETPNQTARVQWRVEPLTDSSCNFSIEVIALIRSDLSDEKKKLYQDCLFSEDLQHYLNCVVKGVAHYSSTGEPVTANQFGENPLYS